MRPRILRLGAMAAVPALAALGLTAVTMTASASTASPAAPAAQVAQSAPNYLANHANPVQEVAGDCAEITDNGGQGLSILSHGTDHDNVTVEDTGNCDVAIHPEVVPNGTPTGGTAYEYENQSGNCLYVDTNDEYVITASGCSAGDGFEEWIGFTITDLSGNGGWNLMCTAAGNLLCGYGSTPICADGSTAGSDVSPFIPTYYTQDICVWTVP
jgi:hypothetical protein